MTQFIHGSDSADLALAVFAVVGWVHGWHDEDGTWRGRISGGVVAVRVASDAE